MQEHLDQKLCEQICIPDGNDYDRAGTIVHARNLTVYVVSVSMLPPRQPIL